MEKIKVAELERMERSRDVAGGREWFGHAAKKGEPCIITGHEGPPRDRVFARDVEWETAHFISEMRGALPALLRLARAARELHIAMNGTDRIRIAEARVPMWCALDAFDFTD